MTPTATPDRENTGASALYFSGVMHKRLMPFKHRFDYKVVTLLADLDELPARARRLRFFSLDRFNIFSFHQKTMARATARRCAHGSTRASPRPESTSKAGPCS